MGDRVILKNIHSFEVEDNPNIMKLLNNKTPGTVVCIIDEEGDEDDDIIGVGFDKYIDGVNCYGTCKVGHGYFFEKRQLEKIG